MSSPFQQRLQAHLQASTLTPGVFSPTAAFQAMTLAAVMVGEKPLLLTGAADDRHSMQQAERFCQSPALKAAVIGLAINGALTARKINGGDIDWPAQCEAVVASAAGVAELDGGSGDLQMISLHPYRGLTTLLCVNTELAQIIDAQAPVMDDGRDLTELLKDVPQVLKFS
ncbi:hypothetical protein SIN8267_01353 [Sinobacterium norvegicum]|uniref:Uncharacterized protein n=1 Tax=Sinobacterium norvegicum TaxID=1641715 RepID=A0ABM9ADG6_9GAMM|nr:hypothetical protein [Sinobacterium norvegicum]CAH0991251.1 hypothetical protein SIN8267_01353 [Sinobacterium norvegicum]